MHRALVFTAIMGCHGGSAAVDAAGGGEFGDPTGCATGQEVLVEAIFDGQAGTATTTPDVGSVEGDNYCTVNTPVCSGVIDLVSDAVTFRDAITHDVISSSTADAFWTAAGVANPAAFAQRGVLDRLTNRYYLTAEENVPGPNRIYLAISATWDALGPYKTVTLPAQSEHLSNTHVAVDRNGVYITADASDHGVVMAMPIADVAWAGTPPTAAHLNVATTARMGLVPAASYTSTDDVVFVSRDPAAIALYPLTWSGTSATVGEALTASLGTTFVLPTRTAPQPDSAPRLDPGNGAIFAASSSNGIIAGIATTEVAGRLAALWFTVARDGQLQQVGTIADPNADLLTPSISINGDTLGVVATSVSETEFPSIVVTGRTADNDPNTMRTLVVARAGQAAYSCAAVAGVSGFGRYSSISSGFIAAAPLGGGSECAFSTAWVRFDIPAKENCAD